MAHCLHAQTVNSPNFDTLPAIRYLGQELPFLDKIRCASYLFAKNYTVKDSLGNIFISLYFDNNPTMDAGRMEPTGLAIFKMSYFFAIEPQISFVEGAYKNLVIDAYQNGQLFYSNYFPIHRYKHFSDPKKFLDAAFTCLRWPVNCLIEDNRFEIYYYCMDVAERSVYPKPLILIADKLKLIDKKCTIWKEYYTNCDNRDSAETFTIKLPAR
jgi:hypothetical protein